MEANFRENKVKKKRCFPEQRVIQYKRGGGLGGRLQANARGRTSIDDGRANKCGIITPL